VAGATPDADGAAWPAPLIVPSAIPAPAAVPVAGANSRRRRQSRAPCHFSCPVPLPAIRCPPDPLAPPSAQSADKPQISGMVHPSAVDRQHIGKVFRAIRRDMMLRQIDVAARAAVSQQAVSDIECGRFGRLSIDVYCRVAAALDADVPLTPRWRGSKLGRLLDRRHAQLQDQVVRLIADAWEVRSEATFNDLGERGSVDILAWRADRQALLIIEIKSEIYSLEETLRTLNLKARAVPRAVEREPGRRARHVAAILVLPDGSTHRDVVARHSALVDASLPSRTVAVRHWLADPNCDFRGVWFLRNTDGGGAMRKLSPPERVRMPRKGIAGSRVNTVRSVPIRSTDIATPPRSERPPSRS
jgi:transcriptional regulator with XRE-family HTH domain